MTPSLGGLGETTKTLGQIQSRCAGFGATRLSRLTDQRQHATSITNSTKPLQKQAQKAKTPPRCLDGIHRENELAGQSRLQSIRACMYIKATRSSKTSGH